MEGGLSESREVLSPSAGGAGLVLAHGPSLNCSHDYTLEARRECSGRPQGAGGEGRSPSSAWASAVFSCPTWLWARARSLSTSLSQLLRWRTWVRQLSWEKVKGQQAGLGGVGS